MRTLEDCVGVVDWTGDGLRLIRFAHGSCSCFITLLTPVSHDATLLFGIRPVGNESVVIKSKNTKLQKIIYYLTCIIP